MFPIELMRQQKEKEIRAKKVEYPKVLTFCAFEDTMFLMELMRQLKEREVRAKKVGI
jgi:hypothetical protein